MAKLIYYKLTGTKYFELEKEISIYVLSFQSLQYLNNCGAKTNRFREQLAIYKYYIQYILKYVFYIVHIYKIYGILYTVEL